MIQSIGYVDPEYLRMAAQLLLERLVERSERPAQRISFPTRLILGGSCAPVQVRDEAVLPPAGAHP